MQKPELPPPDEIQKLGITDFVGAATDGKYGTAAFDFRSPHDPLVARKAWFFFDDEYVCLGSGISCRNRNLDVVTTINQCHLRGEVTLSSAGKKSILENGENEYENVNWIYHDRIGYVFPQPASVHIKNSKASGSWWRINKQTRSSKDEINLDVFTLWLDHGNRPSNAIYEYIVVPATSIEKLEQHASTENISILANTPEVQAVSHAALNICQAVFYKAGEIQLAGNLKLKCEAPGIVIFQTLPQNEINLTVSDPNRELGKMHLSISTKIEKEGEHFKAFWNEKEQVSEIIIDLPDSHYAGSSVTIKL
jgi:chondroitin AC lyase